MLTFRLAKDDQFEQLLELTYNQTTSYLQPTLDLIQLTWEQFGHYFRTVGQVYCIYDNEQLAGYYWLDLQNEILHLHGLILKTSYQGKGIGTRVLNMLEATYQHRIGAIELRVHRSNPRAKALYERSGYHVVRTIEDFGFFIMQKPLNRAYDQDFISWLLKSGSPSIRYLTLCHLLNRPVTNTGILAECKALNTSGLVQVILSKQKDDGSWPGERSYYTPKYTSTHWSMLLLSELQVDGSESRFRRAVRYMLGATKKELDLANEAGECGLACFWGNLLRYTLHARQYEVPATASILGYLVRQAMEAGWRCPHNNDLPCAWGTARCLWGMAALPEELRSAEVEDAICSGVKFLLQENSLLEATYPDESHIHPMWFRLNFPLFYQVDILFVLRVLAELGRIDDPGAQPALGWLAERRMSKGHWRGSSPFRKRTWKEIGDSKETDRWVSLQAAKVLATRPVVKPSS